MDPLDGNALAGPLGALFGPAADSLRGVCAGCGRADALAGGRLYTDAAGLVLRCRGCDHALVTVVESSDDVRLGLSGLRYLVATSSQPAVSPRE